MFEANPSCLPTLFAVKMAESVGIFDEDKKTTNEFTRDLSPEERLEIFQSVAIAGTFEESLAAGYYGKNIDKKQETVLKVIHELTGKWLRGKLSQNLLDRLDIVMSLPEKGKDIADITSKLIELLGITSEQEGSGGVAGKRFMIEYTHQDDKKKTKKKAS
jgi:hypothetical protein